MDVCVTTEQRFKMTPNGIVYTKVAFKYDFWHRYFEIFDRVKVFARVKKVNEIPNDWIPSSGDRVEFYPLPHYIGPQQFLFNYFKVKSILKENILEQDAKIFRVPSQIANCIIPNLNNLKQPFGLEIVGDPWMSMAKGAVSHPLRQYIQRYFRKQMQQQCLQAAATAYVTESNLQKHYPSHKDKFTTFYSSINLQNEDLANAPKYYEPSPNPVIIITVGSMTTYYKGQDTLLEAVKICNDRKLKIKLYLMGDGIQRPYFEERMKKLALSKNVTFLGRIKAGKEVRDWLDKADLFVLPSRTEGLPRALIEAMARGLPAIGTNIGGIPELLDDKFLVPADNPEILASKISELLSSPDLMNKAAQINLECSRKYLNSLISKRRVAFYNEIKQETLNHMTNY